MSGFFDALTAPRRRRARRRGRWLVLAAGLAAIGAVALAMAGRDVLAAKRDYDRGRALLTATEVDGEDLLDAGVRDRLSSRFRSAGRSFAAGSARLDGSRPLRLVALVPGGAHQRRGAVQLGSDGAASAVAAAELLDAASAFAERSQPSGPAVPVAEVARLREVLERSHRTFARSARGRRSLWGPLGDARVALDREARAAAARTADAADAAAVTASFAGGDRPRRHLVVGLNTAELRDQGMVLSYAVVLADGGSITVERSGPIAELAVAAPVSTEVPSGTLAAFGDLAPNQEWRSVNASADFALSGRLMADLYASATGGALDGVVGVDASALAVLLEATGPVEVPELRRRLDATTVVPFLLHDQYDGLGPADDQGPRRERVAGLAGAIVERMRAITFDRPRLARGLGRAAAAGHLRLWSADADEEATFERVGLGGGPVAGVAPALAARTFHVSVQDATATKVDFFVRPRVEIDVRLTSGGRAVVRTDVVVANGAPAGAPRSYALGPTRATGAVGEYRARVYLWGPRGASQPDSNEDAGLRVSRQGVVVAPGAEGRVRFETVLRDAVVDGRLRLRLVGQPRHRPITAVVRFRDASGETSESRSVVLDRPRVVEWQPGRSSGP